MTVLDWKIPQNSFIIRCVTTSYSILTIQKQTDSYRLLSLMETIAPVSNAWFGYGKLLALFPKQERDGKLS